LAATLAGGFTLYVKVPDEALEKSNVNVPTGVVRRLEPDWLNGTPLVT
jgi:hypothetical protein